MSKHIFKNPCLKEYLINKIKSFNKWLIKLNLKQEEYNQNNNDYYSKFKNVKLNKTCLRTNVP